MKRTVEEPGVKPIGAEVRMLAAMTYGEASTQNNADEMYSLASVLKRQRDARGYSSMKAFIQGEPSFSFVVSDGNKRYQHFQRSTDRQILSDPAMKTATEAAENALANGPDRSHGAWFWDGADIKSNYLKHFKVENGIRFAHPSHNIYSIKESSKLVIKYKTIKKRIKGEIKLQKMSFTATIIFMCQLLRMAEPSSGSKTISGIAP